jgi:hypothetical protein
MNSNTGTPELKEVEKGTLCAKCRHQNARRRNTCEVCGAHLHVCCKDCGERNARSATRCATCGRRLHRSVWDKLTTKSISKRLKMSPIQIIILFIALAVAFRIIMYVSEVYIPSML